jgi:SCY1-like protein 2
MSMHSMISPTTTSLYGNSTQGSGIDWSKATGTSNTSNSWGGTSTANTNTTSSFSNFPAMAPPPSQLQSQSNPYSSFNIAPPPVKSAGTNSFSIAPPPMANKTVSSGTGMGMNSMASLRAQTQSQQQQRTQQQPSQQQANWGSGGDSLI